MIRFFNNFVKITAWLPYRIVFNTKIYYEDKASQSRKIKGPAIIACNHTQLFDYALLIFLFFGRTLRVLMAEVLFRKKFLGWFLRRMGGIYVNRDARDFSFMVRAEEVLKKGGVIGVFPESRLPRPEETRPLEFKPSAVYIAMNAHVKIIPVYTNGMYFTAKRAKAVIGKPIDVDSLIDESLDIKENISKINEILRNKVIELEKYTKDEKQR